MKYIQTNDKGWNKPPNNKQRKTPRGRKNSDKINHFFITLYALCNMKLKTALMLRNNHLQKSKHYKKMIYIQTTKRLQKNTKQQTEKNLKKPEDITYGNNIRLKRKPWKSQNKV